MSKIDTKGLVSTLIFDVALPEITAAIRRRHAQTGEIPTDDEVKAELRADADKVIATGTAWLHQHGVGGAFRPSTPAELGARDPGTGE